MSYPTGCGWVQNEAGVERVLAALPHAGDLRLAAPHWMGDGQTGDILTYLAYYDADAGPWKPAGVEPPYINQVGNNCTSRGMADGLDLLQCLDMVDPDPKAVDAPVFHRFCVEAVYAFGLYSGQMWGDSGCYGAAIAQGVHEIGCVSYDMIDGVKEENAVRLRSWANDPPSVVAAMKDKAAAFKVGSIARVTTIEEAKAALSNRCIITVASNVGFENPRDAKGICRARGRWPHQMFYGGYIESDGTPSFVQFQSWGPNNPVGPQPFKIPSFGFRVVTGDAERQLAANDSWAISLAPAFERRPLPLKYTVADALAL